MTPLEQIEQGLVEGSLSTIAKAFQKLTGKKVTPPKQSAAAGKAKAKTVTVVQEKLPESVLEVLQFYGDTNNWKAQGDDFEPKPSEVARDRGDKARQVMACPKTVDEAFQPPEDVPEGGIILEPPKPTAAPATDRTGRVIPNFEVQHGPVLTEGGKRYARKEPFQARPNEYRDDGKEARSDIGIDEKLTAGLRPTQRRPATSDVEVECCKCHNKEKMPASQAPRHVEGEQCRHVCQKCIREVVR